MDVRNDAAAGNGGLDQGVQLLVTTNGELQVTGGDTLHLQVLGGVACQLENLKVKQSEHDAIIETSSRVIEPRR